MKKNSRKGPLPLVKASCGAAGCEYKQYTMPYMGTKEDFLRHLKEKFKTFKQAA